MSDSSDDKKDPKTDSVDSENLRPTLIHEVGTPQDDHLSSATRSKYSSRGTPQQGGMAIVWKAFDSQLQREVAYKELRPETAGDSRFQSMFVNEAKLTGQLEHPNIVPVYEMGQSDSDERPFYTMKFLRGSTLTEAIRERRSQPSSHPDPRVRLAPMLKTLLRVCDAMRYAHSRGIIHRDLKPDNVMVGDYGEVVVLDWGLAKPIASNESELPPIKLGMSNRSETEVGVRKGTPAYWAPEQAEGRNDLVDQRTDVYGIGAILYEILTGLAPHARRNGVSDNTGNSGNSDNTGDSQTPASTSAQDTTPQIDKSVPQPLIAICSKAMAEKRSDRYSSVSKLARDIDRWLIDEPVSAHHESWHDRFLRWGRRNQVASLFAGVCMLAIVVVAGSLYSVDQIRRKQVTDQEIQSLHEFATSQGSKLTSYITSLRQDVTFLSKLEVIQEFLQQSNASTDQAVGENANQTASSAATAPVDRKRQIDAIFNDYLAQKYDYMQVRVLDLQGNEIVRVERSAPGGTPKIGKLSKKGDRPYFLDTIKLGKADWYLSPIELNVENGQKQPELPVIRAAVPIYQDEAAKPSGIVIINTHFREIVKSLDSFDSHENQGAIYLTNRKGQFLYHPENDLSFGFERKLNYRIQNLYTELNQEFEDTDFPSARTKRTGMISQATEAQPAAWVRTQLRPYQISSKEDTTFESIGERFLEVLTNSKSAYPDLQYKIGEEGEAILFGVGEEELSALTAQIESTFGYPVDVKMLPERDRSKSHAVHLNFLPLQLGNDDRSLGLILALPSDAFASHAGTGRNIFWITAALLLCVIALTFFLTTRRVNRVGSL